MNKLLQKKIKILEQIRKLDDIIKGSIYEMKRFCGYKNCKCIRTNTPHKSMFLSFKYKGKTKLVSIKKENISEIKKKINNYKKLKKYLDELANINSELLKDGFKNEKKYDI